MSPEIRVFACLLYDRGGRGGRSGSKVEVEVERRMPARDLRLMEGRGQGSSDEEMIDSPPVLV